MDEWKESNPEVILVSGGWKVFTGMKSLGKTPNETFTPFDMNKNYHSKQFGVILSHGIKFLVEI